MVMPQPGVVVGLDIGGTTTNATVLDGFGWFLVRPGCGDAELRAGGTGATLDALADALDGALAGTDLRRPAVARSGWTRRARPAPTG